MTDLSSIPVVLLAGGKGTRITEESVHRPKPMIEIGGIPILVHIMRLYGSWGFKRFIICAGYKADFIKQYFVNFTWTAGDIEIDTSSGEVRRLGSHPEDWRVSIVDTGAETMTGGRLRRIRHLLAPGKPFCMTYGDGLSDIDLRTLVESHVASSKLCTVTAVTPPGRFGALVLDADNVRAFEEKPRGDGSFINGGFFVMQPEALDLVDGDPISWEKEPMERLVALGQLRAFKHDGFWQPMDTLRDKNLLEDLWASGKAPWRRA